MSGVNKVILVGRLGKDPEVRNLENGGRVANFTLATSESYKDKTTGDRKEITEWHSVVVWNGLSDIAAKFLHKGDMVFIEGKLKTRSWEKDNIKRYTTEIVADNMTMLSTKQGGGIGQPNASNNNQQASTSAYADAPAYVESDSTGAASDDLPF